MEVTMKIKMIAVPLVVLLTAIAGHAQNVAASPVGAEFVGVWRAEADGLPFVTLNISNESGNLSGAVLFYLHRRDQGKPVTSTPGIPEPIFNPHFDGMTLTFQVSHRHAHPPRTLSDPPVNFRLKLTGTDTGGMSIGELTNEREASSGLQLVRSDR
jgi:hypothetical protein